MCGDRRVVSSDAGDSVGVAAGKALKELMGLGVEQTENVYCER